MIIQCEQCRTKFRLDDSKIKENGVKVRCAKCRHVFTVMKQQPEQAEQSDFGAMLEQSSALGATPQEAESGFPQEQAAENPFAAAQEQEQSGQSFDFGAVEPPQEEQPQAPAEEFSFSANQESAPAMGETPPSPPGEFQFGEVDFGQPAEQPTMAESALEPFPEAKAAAPHQPFGDEFDFQPLDSQQQAASVEEQAPAAPHGEIDFGQVDFGQPEVAASAEPFIAEQGSATPQVPPPLEFEFDLPESNDTQSQLSGEKTETVPAGPENIPTADAFDFAMELPTPPSGQKLPQLEEAFSFDVPAETAITPPQPAAAVPSAALPVQPEPVQPAGTEMKPYGPVISPAPEPAPGTADSDLVPPEPAQEELPPLSIPSRRKSSSLLKALVALLVLAMVGAAAFYGKDLYPKLKQMIAPESGKIQLRSISSSFVRNTTTGSELLVISGEAVNGFTTPRASLQVKGMVYGDKGQVLASKNAYCGNPLSAQQLASMPLDAIELAMANQVGSGLSNLEIAPGKALPFTVVIATVPEGAKNIGIVPAGSQALGEKAK
ncbi:DUF3426 domain-containing protein [Pelobacter propionicus]|uniref:MJ0042 family finger-like protein n=1 Tax=Pelobacter propionicus (strain DSM 2379 / NBRC 103807 / OttBd1) TaxID=338966 RepID=A1AJZ4_PELPD|nr:DUF3426 domain-containing protein [Pelobacter propionicus]ABK97664.1 MJ0042 family finger-like protein [Pelobacter propionicus DSM 2379]